MPPTGKRGLIADASHSPTVRPISAPPTGGSAEKLQFGTKSLHGDEPERFFVCENLQNIKRLWLPIGELEVVEARYLRDRRDRPVGEEHARRLHVLVRRHLEQLIGQYTGFVAVLDVRLRDGFGLLAAVAEDAREVIRFRALGDTRQRHQDYQN